MERNKYFWPSIVLNSTPKVLLICRIISGFTEFLGVLDVDLTKIAGHMGKKVTSLSFDQRAKIIISCILTSNNS